VNFRDFEHFALWKTMLRRTEQDSNGDNLAGRPRGGVVREILRLGPPLLILAGGIGGFLMLTNLRGAPTLQSEAVPPPAVATVPAAVHDQGVDIEVDGIVVPYREISVAAEVGGRIKFKADVCRAGNYVTQGTLLVEIDPLDYQLEVERLQTEREQAEVSLKELDVQVANTRELIELAETDVQLQRQELDRLRSLEGERIVSQTQVDQASRAELAARNALLTRRNELRLLEAGRDRLVQGRELAATKLKQAELDRQRTRIVAPSDGVIVQDLVEQDSYIQKGASLFVLEDTSSVEVKCSLRMEELYWVWQQAGGEGPALRGSGSELGYRLPPTPVTVIYRLRGRAYAWDGILARYDGLGLDERTRTVPCRVVVEDPKGARSWDQQLAFEDGAAPTLVRGMYVTVLVHTQPRTTLLSIPEQAVQPGNVVWLVEEGKLRRKRIEASQLGQQQVLVDQRRVGFEAGARVGVSPLPHAYDGMAVREK
jgi:multidrug efflux pump subunit AcrA (membrane-fusion protein)